MNDNVRFMNKKCTRTNADKTWTTDGEKGGGVGLIALFNQTALFNQGPFWAGC